jgi:hypothetical protein
MLALIAIAMIASMGPWFAASASSAAIQRELSLSVAQAAWLTMMVQLGFVAGTLLIAAAGAADAIAAHRLMACGGAFAAVSTASLAWVEQAKPRASAGRIRRARGDATIIVRRPARRSNDW